MKGAIILRVSMNQLDFAGRNAIVTGGAQGIGLAIVERLVASGARVRVWDRDRKLLEASTRRLGSAVSGEALDVTDAESIERGARRALDELGRIDVLVNNAGIAGMTKPVVEYPIDEWKRVIDIDLTGPFLCCRAVVPHMTRAGYGRIVNIASIAGKEGNPNAAAYGAAKGGLIAFTKSLGKELAQTGVLVNCVTPAAAQTAILEQVTPEFAKFMLSKIPMGRFVKVDEIAALACWLASDDCSFSTGGVFDISGGRATY
jgi:3-oxoacyl-[acyl-carrier protein] reductase